MARGLIIPVTPAGAVERARAMIGRKIPPPGSVSAPLKTIGYELRRYNGGTNPAATHPASWNPSELRWTCDCSGFVAWALGFDRYQLKLFPGGWINTDSMLADAKRKGEWFEAIKTPAPGCLVVYGAGAKVGHVGLVSHVPDRPNWDTLRVVHCSSGNERRTGDAIQETSAAAFDRKGTRFLRYLRADRST